MVIHTYGLQQAKQIFFGLLLDLVGVNTWVRCHIDDPRVEYEQSSSWMTAF